jgi:hypothetical protein
MGGSLEIAMNIEGKIVNVRPGDKNPWLLWFEALIQQLETGGIWN